MRNLCTVVCYNHSSQVNRDDSAAQVHVHKTVLSDGAPVSPPVMLIGSRS